MDGDRSKRCRAGIGADHIMVNLWNYILVAIYALTAIFFYYATYDEIDKWAQEEIAKTQEKDYKLSSKNMRILYNILAVLACVFWPLVILIALFRKKGKK